MDKTTITKWLDKQIAARKKLAQIGANVKIKATRNAGYSLEIEE